MKIGDCNKQATEHYVRPGKGEHLDERLEGVWWLTNQEHKSSLMSFGESRDGCGDSTGNSKGNTYNVRVFGDKTWSFSDTGLVRTIAQLCDLTYTFNFKRNAAGKLEHASIIPHGCKISMMWKSLLNFEMTYAGKYKNSNSHVWRRDSYVFNREVELARYELVQVQDGDGNPLQPAYDEWVKFSSSNKAGSTPGKFFYMEMKIPSHTTTCET